MPSSPPEAAPRAWLERGVEYADAPALFHDAAVFYAQLAGELDAWGRGTFLPHEPAGFAASRRRLLHNLLDRALDVVEILGGVERGRWP